MRAKHLQFDSGRREVEIVPDNETPTYEGAVLEDETAIDEGGALCDGTAEPQAFTTDELSEIEASEGEIQAVGSGAFQVITNIRSANFSRNRKMSAPFGIVLHHTGGSFQGDLATLTKPASNPKKSVSANDYITKKGVIYELCPHPRRAWHAGVTDHNGIRDWNTHGYGIEIENRGGAGDPYPQRQIDAVVWRCRRIRKKLAINDRNMFVRHRDICVPRGRKPDTSDGFPFLEVKKRVFAAADPTDDLG
jgi:N-acetyl-anhydromuramyl-L-alanine amidase AmpD